MNIGSTNSPYLQPILSSALQDAGLTTNKTNSTNGADALSSALQPDQGQISDFAQLMSTLDQLQQSDPAKYQQVTGQIATDLQTAAQTAQSEGDTTAANHLDQLSGDFADASKSGNLPNAQDLAQAIGGHSHSHGHHHHAQAASSDTADSTSSSDSASQTLSQLLSAFQTDADPNAALNPMNIILGTLSTAGIDGSNG